MKQVIQLMTILLILMSMSCKKKNQTPTEYFSFDANGVHYDYPQDVKEGFGTSRRALYAVASSATVGYFIVGSSFKDATVEGEISFRFSGNHIPDKDTIILDGNENTVAISSFIAQEGFFDIHPPQKGKIIFTERTKQRLSGVFEFEVESYVISNVGGIQWTGNTITVTNGKFSIIPSN